MLSCSAEKAKVIANASTVYFLEDGRTFCYRFGDDGDGTKERDA